MKRLDRSLDLLFAIVNATCLYLLVYVVLSVADISPCAWDFDGRPTKLIGIWKHILPASLALNTFFIIRSLARKSAAQDCEEPGRARSGPL